MIVVNTAFYGRSSEINACGYTGNTNCTLDATCYMKRICDGKESCENVMVNGSKIGKDPCPGMKKYLYLDYQCLNQSNPEVQSNGKRLFILCDLPSRLDIPFTNAYRFFENVPSEPVVVYSVNTGVVSVHSF